MRRLMVVLLLACACANGPSPVRTPAAPIDLVFTPAAGGLAVYSTSDGALVAQLPAGAFDARVTTGGDLGEAYLVNADGVNRVKAGRPFQVTRAADTTGTGPWQAVLVPAPGLTTFVGERTVLVTLSAGGELAGYQSGNRIWKQSVPGATQLRRAGDFAVLGRGDAWSTVIAVDGRTEALAGSCPAGPVGGTAARVVIPCPGATGAGLSVAAPAAGTPFEIRPISGGTVLAWPDGSFVRFSESAEVARGHGAGGGRPGVSPDGASLYWPASVPGAAAVATSRDGNFLFAVGQGTLRTFTTTPRRQLGAWPAEGSDIRLVVGG